jgi:maleylacetate reductase
VLTEEFVYTALPGRIVFATGSARDRLADEVARLEMNRVLLIATERSRDLAAELTASFADRRAGTFSGVRPHVPVEVAAEARRLAGDLAADGLLCLGGGSTIGTAKAVALDTGLPIIAIPTTYAGSETTPVWGLTEAGRKTTGVDGRVLPRTVIYDPDLTLSMPVELSVASGLNALAHCVDSFWAPGHNPVSALSAEAGIRALAGALPAILLDGSDRSARSAALYGAYPAGSAFAVAGSGLHHKICHVLGGAYNLPHAQTHAVILPYVLAYNSASATAATSRVCVALGVSEAVPGLMTLIERLGAPRALAALGLREDQLDEAAELIGEKVPADNPRRVRPGDLRRLLQAAWAGEDPAVLDEGISQ